MLLQLVCLPDNLCHIVNFQEELPFKVFVDNFLTFPREEISGYSEHSLNVCTAGKDHIKTYAQLLRVLGIMGGKLRRYLTGWGLPTERSCNISSDENCCRGRRSPGCNLDTVTHDASAQPVCCCFVTKKASPLAPVFPSGSGSQNYIPLITTCFWKKVINDQ